MERETILLSHCPIILVYPSPPCYLFDLPCANTSSRQSFQAMLYHTFMVFTFTIFYMVYNLFNVLEVFKEWEPWQTFTDVWNFVRFASRIAQCIKTIRLTSRADPRPRYSTSEQSSDGKHYKTKVNKHYKWTSHHYLKYRNQDVKLVSCVAEPLKHHKPGPATGSFSRSPEETVAKAAVNGW